MKNGERILIKDMSDSHLLNSIKFFENIHHCKNMEERKQQVKWLIEERNKRLGIIDEGPVKSRAEILDLRKDDANGL